MLFQNFYLLFWFNVLNILEVFLKHIISAYNMRPKYRNLCGVRKFINVRKTKVIRPNDTKNMKVMAKEEKVQEITVCINNKI